MMFRSAGFLDPDQSCPRDLVTVLQEHGVDGAAHRSYQLDEASVAAADLLLTMEGRHVQKATMVTPDAFSKIVPLKEAAAVLERMPGSSVSIEDFLAELNRERDPRNYLGTQWDVDDPFGRKIKAYRAAVAEIDGLVTTVLGRLTSEAGPG